jgi:hypothetical protein
MALTEDELAHLIHEYEMVRRPIIGCGWQFDSTRDPWTEDGSTRVAWEGEPPKQVPLCPCRGYARRMLAERSEISSDGERRSRT